MAVKRVQMETIASKKVADQVLEQLLIQIRQGTWKSGEKLPSENELCGTFNVSRISIREAIKQLAAMGLVETHQGEGSFLKEISIGSCAQNALRPMFVMDPPSLLEIIEFRSIMEPGAMALAADRITLQEIEELEKYVTDMKDESLDIRAFIEDDLKFHVAISKDSHNSFIIKMNDFMFDMLREGMISIVAKLGREDGIHYHTTILEALKRGDKQTAITVMTEHIERTATRIKALVDDNQSKKGK